VAVADAEGRGPWLTTRRRETRLEVSLGGAWTTRTVAAVNRKMAELERSGVDRAVIDAAGLEEIDTAGAWVIHRTVEELRAGGLEVSLQGVSEAVASLLEAVKRDHIEIPPPPPAENPLVAVLLRLGAGGVYVIGEARDLLSFLGFTIVVFLRSLLHPSRIRFTALVSHIEQSGLNAMPIVGLISFLVGVVLAYQGAEQLARFGAQIFTVNLVAVGVLREMGILLTAIIVAGRSGSAFTAQIGTMNVNEEIDAMRTIGLDPMEVLVLPRIFGLVLVLPLLTFYADIMGLLGGAMMATAVLDISLLQFARQLNDAVDIWAFWVGMIKAPIFAFVIAMVGCYEGLQVSRSAESVGRQTTRSVVESIFLVIVLDAMFSILFSVLGV
jgi:phospholipid/cholesterol/gamma-HCH transport system permease protein